VTVGIADELRAARVAAQVAQQAAVRRHIRRDAVKVYRDVEEVALAGLPMVMVRRH